MFSCNFKKLIIIGNGGIGDNNVSLLKIIRIVRAKIEFYIRELFKSVY